MPGKLLVLSILLIVLNGCQHASYAEYGYRTMASLVKCKPNAWLNDGIIGGREVAVGDPDQTLVTQLRIWRGDRGSICTGSLISDRTILTAAHCVAGLKPSDVEARFVTSEGCPAYQQRSLDLEVSKIAIHEGFDGTPKSYSDLALIYLKSPAPNTQTRLPLLGMNETPSSDEIVFLGFGITDESKKDSQVLRRVSKSYQNELKISGRTITVDQTSSGGFCRGDSGAALIAYVYGEPKIIGVNSANVGMEPMKECHTLSVAMNTTHFAPWIQNQKAQLEAKSWLDKVLAYVPFVDSD